jgi:alpha/beta superfamily hydrolase
MDNGQLVDFQKILYSKGYSALRFNFRGVGKSEGDFGDGSSGDRDLAGALTFIENNETIKPSKIFLFGYSYGSMVAFNVALTDKRVNGAVLVGFPTRTISSFGNYKGINNPEVPLYILAGGQDKISYGIKKAVTDFVAATYHKMKLTIIPTADHFFQGNWLNIFNASIQFYEDILAGKFNDTKESKQGSEQEEKQ